MRYRVFPATGDQLSVLGFGAMGLAGWFGAIDDRDAIRAMHTALDLGVNVSEQVVGAGLRSWSGPKPFVATTVKPRNRPSPGDHAQRPRTGGRQVSGGPRCKFEISQLIYCRPELVDMARVDRASRGPLGFAQNPDAHEATSEYGEQIIEAMMQRVGDLVDEAGVGPSDPPFLTFDDVEPGWAAVEAQRGSWVSRAGDRSSPLGLR